MSLFVHGLSALDLSWWCGERGLVGASWHVDLLLNGELGEDGMLFDFGEVKPWAKHQIDSTLDHTLLVPTQMAGVSVTECREGLCVRFSSPWPMEIRAPRQAFTLLPWQVIDADRIGRYLSEQLMKRPPARVTDIQLSLREEPIPEGFWYSYSHGLKRHTGNCQRIAHGHRSRLYIWRDGELDEALIQHWCDRLADSYLVDKEDCIGAEESDTLSLTYDAPQGHFRMTLPRQRTATLPTTTTVELIAQWIANETALMHSGRIRVQAFEGIGKGAIAEAQRS